MNQPSDFGDRLLAVLEAEVEKNSATAAAEQTRYRNRRVRLGALVGAIAVPIVLDTKGNSAAWAVETRADGSVILQIDEFVDAAADAAAVERRLAEAGIRADINFAPDGMVCAQRTIRNLRPGEGPEVVGERARALLIRPGQVAPDERLVLTWYATANGETGAVHINVVPIEEERCEIVPQNWGTPDPAGTPTPSGP